MTEYEQKYNHLKQKVSEMMKAQKNYINNGKKPTDLVIMKTRENEVSALLNPPPIKQETFDWWAK